MAKGKVPGTKGLGGETFQPTKDAPRDSVESSVSAVESLCRPTRAKLYGFDFGKKRLSDTLNKGKTFRVSQAVSILANAEENQIKPICKAFLKKFGFKSASLQEPMKRRMFFEGGDKNGDVKPKEMKYAVLRILGLSESVAFNQIGMHDENSADRISLALSPEFSEKVEQVQMERNLYPLKHTDEFPELTQVLDGVVPPLSIDNIFKKDRVPPVMFLPQKVDNQSELPLDTVLSILKLALEGRTALDIASHMHGLSAVKVPEKEVEILLSTPESSPFTPEALRFVESKRDEKKAQRVQHERSLG